MKRVICVLALLVVLFAAVPAHAQSYIGSYCWKLDPYADTYHWKVSLVTESVYQLTGWSPFFPTSGLTGMARIVQGTEILYGNMVLTNFANGWRQLHAFTLNLATSTGVTKFNYINLDGSATPGATYTVAFHFIPCTLTAAPEPGEVSTESLIK